MIKAEPNQPSIKNDNKVKTLKDFLYLDIERVRSFAAQFYNGLPETRTLAGSKNESMNASLGVKSILGADAKVFTEKSTTETQSMHLALFNMLESEAKAQGFVDVDNLDGPLVEIRCQMRLIDYSDMSRKVRLMSEISPLIDKIQNSAELTKAQRNLNKVESKKQKDQFNNIASVVDNIFGEELYGIGYIDDEPRISMHLQRDYLQMRSTGLIGTSQEVLSEQWTVFGMVVKKRARPTSAVSEDPFAEAINTMNIAFDNMKEQLTPGSDTIDIVPIAIYREFSPRNKE